MSNKVYVALGGNVGDVQKTIQKAIVLLSKVEGIENVQLSPLYKTSPVNVSDSSDWFINGVCSFDTALHPRQLFHIIEEIEKKLGKTPKPKNSSRLIDLDLLFYYNITYKDKELEIPHPKWKERLFVLVPLSDLVKEIRISASDQQEIFSVPALIDLLKKIENDGVKNKNRYIRVNDNNYKEFI